MTALATDTGRDIDRVTGDIPQSAGSDRSRDVAQRDERPDEGDCDLPAMGMAGNKQVQGIPCGEAIDLIWLVSENHPNRIALSWCHEALMRCLELEFVSIEAHSKYPDLDPADGHIDNLVVQHNSTGPGGYLAQTPDTVGIASHQVHVIHLVGDDRYELPELVELRFDLAARQLPQISGNQDNVGILLEQSLHRHSFVATDACRLYVGQHADAKTVSRRNVDHDIGLIDPEPKRFHMSGIQADWGQQNQRSE